MGQILLKSQSTGTTLVSNTFIDNYISQMNESQIKIYLYLLRCIGDNMPVSVSSIADRFNYIENDVLRSLRYLHKVGLIQVELDTSKGQSQEIVSICVNDCPESPRTMRPTVVKTPAAPVVDGGLVIPPSVSATSHFYPAEQLSKFKERSDVRRLIYISQQLLGKILTAEEMNTLLYIYDGLGFPVDLIEFIVEHSVNSGGKNMNYVETVAIRWHADGIKDLETAKLFAGAGRHYSDGYKVLKSLGITGRSLVSEDMVYVNKWLDEYDMDLDVVLEACSRTIKQIAKPSLTYADGILTNWNKNGVKHFQDIKAVDDAFAASKKSSAETQKKPAATAGRKNAFKNFDERENDMDALTREILAKQKPI